MLSRRYWELGAVVIATVKITRSALVLETRELQVTYSSQPQFSGASSFWQRLEKGKRLLQSKYLWGLICSAPWIWGFVELKTFLEYMENFHLLLIDWADRIEFSQTCANCFKFTVQWRAYYNSAFNFPCIQPKAFGICLGETLNSCRCNYCQSVKRSPNTMAVWVVSRGLELRGGVSRGWSWSVMGYWGFWRYIVISVCMFPFLWMEMVSL